MTENINTTSNATLTALSDLKSYFRSGAVKSKSADNTNEENKTTESGNRDVTRKALSELQGKSYNINSSALEINRPDADEESNALSISRPDNQVQSPLEINRPDADEESNALSINRPDNQVQSPLSINRPEENTVSDPLKVNLPDKEAATKTASSSLPKQKNAILYELRNTMHSNYSAWDIAKKYGISYLQAQEIYVDLNSDANGVVKEFNLPTNSTVSYLV